MIETRQLMEAMADVYDLIEEGIRRMQSGGDPQDGWVESLVIDRMPVLKRTGYCLLVLRAVQERAIGVVEAWLDDPSTEPQARDHLTGLIAQLLGARLAADLHDETPRLAVEVLVTRTPELGEIVGATRFVLSVLDLTDSLHIHGVILDG